MQLSERDACAFLDACEPTFESVGALSFYDSRPTLIRTLSLSLYLGYSYWKCITTRPKLQCRLVLYFFHFNLLSSPVFYTLHYSTRLLLSSLSSSLSSSSSFFFLKCKQLLSSCASLRDWEEGESRALGSDRPADFLGYVSPPQQPPSRRHDLHQPRCRKLSGFAPAPF